MKSIIGIFFKTEDQIIKYIKDKEVELKKKGLKVSKKFYNKFAVIQARNGFLLTNKNKSK